MGVLICDFTGVYEKEGLIPAGTAIDLKDISGTGMYIDEEAEESIRKRLQDAGFPGEYRLRFLDNGNYHYMTRILASYIDVPFDLITFDNHTDDKPSAFEGLRSCGSWRLDIKKENRMLQESILIQKAEDLDLLHVRSALPLYISLDKDILSGDVLNTNWDQGDMTEEELFGILDMLYKTRNVIALDVCGEDLPDKPCALNAAFNKRIMNMLQYVHA